MNEQIASDPITTLGFLPGADIDAAAFPPEDLAAAEALIAGFLGANLPDLDFSREGTLYEKWVRPGAVSYLVARRMHETAMASMTVAGATSAPDADPDLVAAILSNFLVEPDPGSVATGEAMVQVSSSRTYRIGAGTLFVTEQGLEFASSATVVTTTSEPMEGQVPLLPGPTPGAWHFMVPLSAVTAGSVHNIPRGTQFRPGIQIPSLILATARSSFSGGRDGEIPSDLKARIVRELSVRNMVSEASLESTIRASFPDLVHVSVTDMSDPAISRNRNPLCGGLPSGGIADVWVRTTRAPLYSTVRVRAVATQEDPEVYRAVLPRDLAPGHYRVRSIRPAARNWSGTYAILSRTKSLDLSVPSGWTGPMPSRIHSPIQGAYSMWQTSEVVFRAGFDTPGAGAPEMDVEIEVFLQPGIPEIQAMVSDPRNRVAGSDLLVRGCVPCMVSVSDLVVGTDGDAEVSADLIRARVSDYIHSVRPGQGVRADAIACAAKSVPGAVSVDLPIRITGTILAPDPAGSAVTISSTRVLDVPASEELGFSPACVAFFADPLDIPVRIDR